MSLLTRHIENYIGGVSQQSYNSRYTNQFNEQINCISSVVNGLIKRPPAELVISKNAENVKVKTHKYSRSSEKDGNFLINIIQDLDNDYVSIFITDLLGNEIPFEDQANLLETYIAVGKNIDNLRFLSLEDTTFIINPDVIVKKSTDKSPERPLQAMVYVKQTDYGKEFKVTINGTIEASYTTPNGANAADSLSAGTDFVAEKLSASMTEQGVSNYIIGGNIIIINLTSESDSVATSDGLGGRGVLGVYKTVGSFTDLPNQAPNNFIVKIINTDENDSDDYYVKFISDGDGDGVGTWTETIGPDLLISFNSDTMPISLVYDENNNKFISRVTEWDERKAGDDDTNPFPSIVDSKINDIFLYKDRLGFITETYVILSQGSNYFNFFRQGVITQYDQDVLDVGSNSYDSYILHSAVPWNEVLMLFSRDKQFVIRSTGGALTSKTISINQAGSYESSPLTKPKEAGTNLLFPATNGSNSNLYEMFLTSYENIEARNTTAHVSNYVPKNIKTIEVLDVYNLCAMMSAEDAKTIYIYQYLFNGSEKVQNAFHKWTFDVEEIFDFKFIDNNMYIICKIEDSISVLSLEINDIQKDQGLDFKIHLDKRADETKTIMTYDSNTEITSMHMPFAYSNPSFVVRSINNLPIGYVIKPIEIVGNMAYFDGSIIDEEFYIGENYSQYLEHSTITSLNPYTEKINLGGRIQILTHQINFDNTGYFRTVVTKKPLSDKTSEYWSKKLNDYENDFEEIKMKSGFFKYSVKSRNYECVLSIINDSHLPCNIQSSEYSYRYYKNTN